MQKNGYAEVGGARFYYEIAGEGLTLSLVHAGIADGRMWDERSKCLQSITKCCGMTGVAWERQLWLLEPPLITGTCMSC